MIRVQDTQAAVRPVRRSRLRPIAVSAVCLALAAMGGYLIIRPPDGIAVLGPLKAFASSPSAANSAPSQSPSSAPASPSVAPQPTPAKTVKPSTKPSASKTLAVQVNGLSITCDDGEVRFYARIKSNLELERIVHRVNSEGLFPEAITMHPAFEATLIRNDVVDGLTVVWSLRFEAIGGQVATRNGTANHPCKT
jgi:hypothetical protein